MFDSMFNICDKKGTAGYSLVRKAKNLAHILENVEWVSLEFGILIAEGGN